MNIKNIISLKEVSQDLKIAKEFYEKQKLLFENMKMQVSLEDSDKIKADNTEIQLEMF